MRQSILEKRVTKLERLTRLGGKQADSHGSIKQMKNAKASWLQQLQVLTEEAKLIGEHAESAGDYRTALACIRELCRIVELMAKLQGELDDRIQINTLSVGVDLETAIRMAETFLARQKEKDKDKESK